MADLFHQVSIDAPADRVFDAVTTKDGLIGWWTDDVEARPEAGTIAQFGFYNRAAFFRMRIDELAKPARVKWTCEGDVPEWTGTTLLWDIQPRDGGSTLNLVHAGWKSTAGSLPQCNTVWGALMMRLKAHCEGRTPEPLHI